MNRYSPYYDSDAQIVRMSIDAVGSWVHINYARKLYDALAEHVIDVSLERSWCQLCRTEGHGPYRGRWKHRHEKDCPLYPIEEES